MFLVRKRERERVNGVAADWVCLFALFYILAFFTLIRTFVYKYLVKIDAMDAREGASETQAQYGAAADPFAAMYGNAGKIDVGVVAPVLGAGVPGVGAGSTPDYLEYNMKGRGLTEKLFYNCGSSYLVGIVGGGGYGFMEGLRNSPSSKFKIRFNSVLNHCGRRGSRLGNALGVLALFYSLFESMADTAELDRYIGGDNYDIVVPLGAGLATGALYKSTQGPKTMALAAALGGTAVLASTAASYVLPSSFKLYN